MQSPPVVSTAAAYQAWVDPDSGDDATGLVSAGHTSTPNAYRTIQAALNAVGAACDAAQGYGLVHLLPGRYGYVTSSAPDANGEIWPVTLHPRVSVRGLDALSVILDGGALAPGAQTYPVSTSLGGAAVTPVFLAEGVAGDDFGTTCVSRVSIVDAQVGLMVTGSEPVNLTLAESLLAWCGVGVLVRSSGSAIEGVHRPRFLWCTMGACLVGLVRTGQDSAGFPSDPRSQPAIVNCLLKNLADLEGVGCSSVLTSAFSASRCNTLYPGPANEPAPTPVVELGSMNDDDLFVGARYVQGSDHYTDWRLTQGMLSLPLPNPALSGGSVTFPATTPNGTSVLQDFGSHALGIESAEGPGTFGPLGPPTGPPSGSHLGYRSGGTFIVGGTAPKSRRFGPSAGTILYDSIHLVTPGTSSMVVLAGHMVIGDLYVPGHFGPTGLLEAPFPLSSLQLPLGGVALSGEWFIDPSQGLADLTSLMAAASPGPHEHHAVVSLGLPPGLTGQVHLLLQGVAHDGMAITSTDMQVFTIGS